MGMATTGTADPRTADPEIVRVWLPGLGSVRLSRPEMAYVGGIVGLTALGLIEWPIALVIAAGHVLAADRSSQTVQDPGRAVVET